MNFLCVCVCRELWELLVVRSEVRAHLHALRDFLLVGCGEFYHCFLEHSRTLFARPPPPKAERGITCFLVAESRRVCEPDSNVSAYRLFCNRTECWSVFECRFGLQFGGEPVLAPTHLKARENNICVPQIHAQSRVLRVPRLWRAAICCLLASEFHSVLSFVCV